MKYFNPMAVQILFPHQYARLMGIDPPSDDEKEWHTEELADLVLVLQPLLKKFTIPEIKILLTEGNLLFALLQHTEESKKVLEYNQPLADVIAKW